VKLEAASGSARVDAFTQADKPHAERRQLVQQHDQVPKVAPEPIQPPHDQRVKLPTPRSLGRQWERDELRRRSRELDEGGQEWRVVSRTHGLRDHGLHRLSPTCERNTALDLDELRWQGASALPDGAEYSGSSFADRTGPVGHQPYSLRRRPNSSAKMKPRTSLLPGDE
jgi:hypothetical protein